MELDVMLCDHAEVAGGKLFISGSAIDRMDLPPGAPPPFVANFAVAGLVRVPWTATNSEHSLSFRFLTEDGADPELPEGVSPAPQSIGGEMRFNVGRPPAAANGQEQLVPFSFNFQGLPLMRTGRYVVVLSLDGTEMRKLSFAVTQQPQTVTYTVPPPVA
jgi:hypothetical protein